MAKTSRVLAIVNQKGGVGKTTTAVNLAACFAASERTTLLIDMDPQGNASSAYGVIGPQSHVYDVLIQGTPIKDVVVETELPPLHLLPAGPDLVGAEIELVSTLARERRLERALEDARGSYELIVIDCPPSLGLLTLNALTAADAVVIPMQCEYYALEGLARLHETVDLVRANLNPRLSVEGIVLTMVDMRNNLTRQVEAEVRSHFGDRVYKTRITRNVRLSEAPSHGKPILLYDVHSKGAIAYLRLADEMLSRFEREDRADGRDADERNHSLEAAAAAISALPSNAENAGAGVSERSFSEGMESHGTEADSADAESPDPEPVDTGRADSEDPDSETAGIGLAAPDGAAHDTAASESATTDRDAIASGSEAQTPERSAHPPETPPPEPADPSGESR